jgi:hypothetical protein
MLVGIIIWEAIVDAFTPLIFLVVATPVDITFGKKYATSLDVLGKISGGFPW